MLSTGIELWVKLLNQESALYRVLIIMGLFTLSPHLSPEVG